ncbi:type VII secretion system-associated protein [Streptomyces microflavus]|uniref:type VII secretion system-associated protein n=1 Tax=Streptomyces microflavus TaxID=1919 RepID=UPI0037D8B8B8
MAGEQADVKHFDLKQMENFRDNEVHPVYTKAKKHKEEGEGEGEGDSRIRPLSELIGGYTTADNLDQESQLLRLGLINREKLISGPTLVESVKSVATSLDKLLGDQMELFKELKEALTETIEEANKTKNKNLDAIDAQTLLQTFEEVDTLTSGSSDPEE